jgi:hypothetical protein
MMQSNVDHTLGNMLNHEDFVKALSGFNLYSPTIKIYNSNVQLQMAPVGPRPAMPPACQTCRERHLQCNRRTPCSRCTLDARECSYARHGQKHGASTLPTDLSRSVSLGNYPKRTDLSIHWMRKSPTPGLLSVLGSGRVDPFSFKGKTIGTRFHDLTDYC